MRKLGERVLQDASRKLCRLHALLQKKGVVTASTAAPENGEAAVRLLLAYELHSGTEKLQQKDARLDPVLDGLQHAIADGARWLMPSVYEGCVKEKWLSPALSALSLQVCLYSGLWSDIDPKCVDKIRNTMAADGVPFPDVNVRAAAKSWMGQPVIAAGTMVEIEVTVTRAHAGASGAKFQKKVVRDGKLVPVMETYACIISRECDTDGGSKGSIVGVVDVDVLDVMQETARGTLKMVAPKQPGTYALRVYLRSAAVLGVRDESECSFEVVCTEALAAQQQKEQEEDSDYD